MAGLQSDQPGGILGLLDLPWEQWEALIADLARMGWRLDQVPHELDWIAVMAIARHAGEGTALWEARRREKVGEQWPADREISVAILDQLRYLNWYEASARAARAKRPIPPAPKPTPRPGEEYESEIHGFAKNADGSTHVGSGPIPMCDFDRWWSASQEERENWKEAA